MGNPRASGLYLDVGGQATLVDVQPDPRVPLGMVAAGAVPEQRVVQVHGPRQGVVLLVHVQAV